MARRVERRERKEKEMEIGVMKKEEKEKIGESKGGRDGKTREEEMGKQSCPRII